MVRTVNGRPKTVKDGYPTSVYLPRRHIELIEEYRRKNGLRSASEAHRRIIEEWVAAPEQKGGGK